MAAFLQPNLGDHIRLQLHPLVNNHWNGSFSADSVAPYLKLFCQNKFEKHAVNVRDKAGDVSCEGSGFLVHQRNASLHQ